MATQLVVSREVADHTVWKVGFDALVGARAGARFKENFVGEHVEDPSLVTVRMVVPPPEGARIAVEVEEATTRGRGR